MKTKFLTILTLVTLLFAFGGLNAHPTGNERRTVAKCRTVKNKKRCKVCAVGKGKHFHPKLNRCHKNRKKK